jgi:hypothetical protein
MAKRNDWEVWLEESNRPTIHSTQKLSKVESRILDDRTWWQEHRSDVREWLEMLLMRVMSIMMLIFLIAILDKALPKPELDCYQTVDKSTQIRWFSCDER